ncbi:MAG: anthranilate phosphoribosyltransferase [Terrimicrobiaceae bacterium]
MLTPLTEKAKQGGSLDREEIARACESLLDESVGMDDRANFLRALNHKGVTGKELAGFAEELLARAVPFPQDPVGAIDVCGTGGDKAGLFNVSTAVMFVAAGAGARVIKHGNRAITSRCGGADVLEALGVKIDLSPEAAHQALETVGCCFLFAPLYHPAVKAIAPVRKLLAGEGTPTVFNLLGPLLNPARPHFQLVGVYSQDFLPVYAEALMALGRRRAWAVHGTGPDNLRLDEVSSLGKTLAFLSLPGGVSPLQIDPAAHGLAKPELAELLGGSLEENTRILESLLANQDHGPRRDLVAINAAAALVVCGLAADLKDGLARAHDSLSSGAAAAKLDALREIST